MADDTGTATTTGTTTTSTTTTGAGTTGTQDGCSPAAGGGTGTGAADGGDKEEGGYWRRQAERHQKELEKLQRAEADRKKAEMTESERLKAERDEAKAELEKTRATAKTERIQSRFESAVTKAGCHDTDAAWALVDKNNLDVDSNGKIVGVDKAIEGLRKAKPYLFAPPVKPSTGSGGGNPGGAPESETKNQRANNWLRAALGG